MPKSPTPRGRLHSAARAERPARALTVSGRADVVADHSGVGGRDEHSEDADVAFGGLQTVLALVEQKRRTRRNGRS